MERKLHGTNGVSKTRRTLHRIRKKLGESYKSYRSSTRNNEVVWQEMKEFSRIEGWKQYMVRKQKYPFEQTLKEARPKKNTDSLGS